MTSVSQGPHALKVLFADTGGTFTDCLALTANDNWIRAKVPSSGRFRLRITRVLDNGIEIEGIFPARQGFFDHYKVLSSDGDQELGVVEKSRFTRNLASDRRNQVDRFFLHLQDISIFRKDDLIVLTAEEPAAILGARFLSHALLKESIPLRSLALATTLATNALLEDKGSPPDLYLTEGFQDLLRIGDQRRSDLFAKYLSPRKNLVRRVIPVSGRLDASGCEQIMIRPPECPPKPSPTAALSLLHGYRNPEIETKLAEHIRRSGSWTVDGSHLAREQGYLRRTLTAVVEAYLHPVLEKYLSSIKEALPETTIRVMTSTGGLVQYQHFNAVQSLLSGPAGGAVGCHDLVRRCGLEKALTFDMGGTSTDVCRVEAELVTTPRHSVGGVELATPSVNLETVAAGGGSICSEHRGLLAVGPESAGAHPGPASYGAGGPLTLTDVHLYLGRIVPEYFNLPLDLDAGKILLLQLSQKVKRKPEETASQLLSLAEERMAAAMRKVAVSQGYDPSDYPLICFGGAGGLHACGIASRLNASVVLFPSDAGLLSAKGLAAAVPERQMTRDILEKLADCAEQLRSWSAELESSLIRSIQDEEGISNTCVHTTLFLRQLGQEASLEVLWEEGMDVSTEFCNLYRKIFGYRPSVDASRIEVKSIKVLVSGQRAAVEKEKFSKKALAVQDSVQRTWIPEKESWMKIPVYSRENCVEGSFFRGPCLVQDRFATLYVASGWEGSVGNQGTIRLAREHAKEIFNKESATQKTGLQRELFLQRFRQIVDEMGAQLERTARSTNIRDRLDFSCGLLDAEGNLVANAPHVPVHLGALSTCVKKVMSAVSFRPGDCVVTNHPAFGGSHLPDITLITPVFDTSSDKLIGFVANRAHHAEIGGLRPGSLSPEAKTLAEEGVVISPRYLLRGGKADWEGLEQLFTKGSFPSRRWEENKADLEAQLAANLKGVDSLNSLASIFGRKALQEQFRFLQEWVAGEVKAVLSANLSPDTTYRAEGEFDDGTRVSIEMSWNSNDRMKVRVEGSCKRHEGNLNATEAIVKSSLAYVLRLMMNEDAPLNEGLLQPVDLDLPHSFLNPDFADAPDQCPPVMGGNVETSQILTEAFIQALGLMAGGPGTMNNLVLGNKDFSYYETIGSGSGACAEGSGLSGVHCHMTNTAITDPEILEARYPLRLCEFSLRNGSGGKGKNSGGDGLVREWEFLSTVEVGWLTERRRVAPKGKAGGGDGRVGKNLFTPCGEESYELPSVGQLNAKSGDRLRIETPGGGAWGEGKIIQVLKKS